MVSSIGSGGSWYSMPSWSASDVASTQDLSDLYSDATSDLSSAFSTAATNQLSGLVNLAADAAAKRLGVNLSTGTSSGTTPSSTAQSTASAPATGPSSAYTNIDQFLARLDGNPAVAPVSASSASTPFSLDNFLGGLDKIADGQSASAPATPSGANFSIASYLASLDKITSRPLPIVNITT